MIRWLHISDLHIREQADWFNFCKEIKKKCNEIGQINFVVATGDFENFIKPEKYKRAKLFLEEIVDCLNLDMSQDLFVIPGNHDCLTSIDYKEELIIAARQEPSSLEKRLPQLLGMFKDYENFILDLIPNYPVSNPASVHLRTWKNLINLVHCNTAIGADGKNKTGQILDIDGLSRLPIGYDKPTLILAHNNFYDINESQQAQIKDLIRTNNIKAYLCGDQHRGNVMQISFEDNQNRQIPCITAPKLSPDKLDDYSSFGIIVAEWENEDAILKGWSWKSGEGFSLDNSIFEKRIAMGSPQIKYELLNKENNDRLSLIYFDKIKNLYKLHKYHITIKDDYFVARLRLGLTEVNTIVFTLYYENPIFLKYYISKLINRVNLVQLEMNYDKIHLVTNMIIDKECQSLIQNLNIEIFSEEDIINKIMDFSQYLKNSIEEFENNQIFKHFIDVYDENTGELLKDTISDFLENANEKAFLILGDYGCGKTSFSYNLLYRLAKEYDNGVNEYVPLFIPLKGYAKAIDFKNLFTDFFLNKCNIINPSLDSFKYLLKYKKFVLIFDGFDEVAKRVDYDIKLEIFNEICKFAIGETKIIVTCRPNFFQEKKEYEKILESQYLQYEPTNSNSVKFSQTYIANLTTDQINTYIDSFKENLKKDGLCPNDIEYLIKNTHDLTDLSKRPFLLNIIIITLPKLVVEIKNAEYIEKVKINAATLYQRYTEIWLDRENKKGKSLISKKDKMYFCKHLAYKMFIEDSYEINYKDFPNEIKQHFSTISDIDEIDYFSHDIQSCTFLNSEGTGNFKFIHKSFMEYFVASKVIDSLLLIKKRDIRKINNVLNIPSISSEIALFINDFINNDTEKMEHIIENLKEAIVDKNIEVRENIITILSKTDFNFGDIIVNGNDYQKSDFSYAIIKNRIIKNVNFSGVSFYEAYLENIVFMNCKFEAAFFQKAVLKNVDFSKQSLEYSDLSYAEISECKFKKSLLAEVMLEQSKVFDNDFDESDMSGCYSTDTLFMNNHNYENVIGIPYNME